MGGAGGQSVHGGQLGQVPQTFLLLMESGEGCIKKKNQLNLVKQSPVESFPHKDWVLQPPFLADWKTVH